MEEPNDGSCDRCLHVSPHVTLGLTLKLLSVCQPLIRIEICWSHHKKTQAPSHQKASANQENPEKSEKNKKAVAKLGRKESRHFKILRKPLESKSLRFRVYGFLYVIVKFEPVVYNVHKVLPPHRCHCQYAIAYTIQYTFYIPILHSQINFFI